MASDIELKRLMNIEYTYPELNDDHFQKKLMRKKEFYSHKIEERKNMDNYQNIKNYRDKICTGVPQLLPQQAFLGNYINPDTPYKGVLVFHGLGTGKCVRGTEYVLINDAVITMEELFIKHNDGTFVFDNDGGVWTSPNKVLYVNSCDNGSLSGGTILKKVKRLYMEKVKCNMRKIVLNNGLELHLTKAHKLLCDGVWSNEFMIGTNVHVPELICGHFHVDDVNIESYVINNEIPEIIMGASNDVIKKFIDMYVKMYDIESVSKHFIIQFYYLLRKVGMDGLIRMVGDKYVLDVCEFDKHVIVEMEEYYYEGYVYDLEIEDVHNYVIGGMLGHNTCAAITIAEKFKPMVQKYGTKIYVLLSGPMIKENWKDELLTCTGETYIKQQDLTKFIDEDEKKQVKINAINAAFQYYKFISYKSYYKKVLGEKITEKVKDEENKIKTTFRKTAEGDFERDFTTDRITELNNCVIIVEEAHNLTGNAYGEALMKVLKNSQNVKVVLLTATPMKNLADDIVELINFIRPMDDPMLRDKIFNKYTNHEMDFKTGGIEYFKKMIKGYISYLRGADPLTMAKRVDMGTIDNGMYFTKIVRCSMLEFQRKIYDQAIEVADVLDRKSAAVANFVFPKLDEDKNLVGAYGIEGINVVKNQLKMYGDLLNKKIATEILHNPALKNSTDLIYINDKTNMITGTMLLGENLKYFSVKFYQALSNINELVWGKAGARTGFIYSNLVKVGVEVFQEIMLINGYLEYDDNRNNYKIEPNTRCYFCGKGHSEHQGKMDGVPEHTFRPATFVSVTGKSGDETEEVVPEEKQRLLRGVFSNVDNVDGKHIKFILGSKIMNEGLSLNNVAEVHILDVYYNLSKVDQTIGRAIRHCKHYDIMTEKDPFPEVKVYKYAVSLGPGAASSEEELYKKAELKYLLVKKIERAMKEAAIDCPLNRSGNMFAEDIKQYKGCVRPEHASKDDKNVCPALCDFMECEYKCDEDPLPSKIDKADLDMTTFTYNLARNEIEIAKSKIKELYRLKFLYTLKDIVNSIKNSYEGEKKELFDDFFAFEALNELTPMTENDFNNYADTIYDMYNRSGYLIHVSKYYIFQPFDQPKNVPMYYRSIMNKQIREQLSLYNYLKNVKDVSDISEAGEEIVGEEEKDYDFNSVKHYYEARQEFKYVGVIDKEPSKRKAKVFGELLDVFRIREKRSKFSEKKRGVGILTLYGSVCHNSYPKSKLMKIAKSLGIDVDINNKKGEICDIVRDKLLFMEKYATDKAGDKFTYMMIPKGHPKYPFPYNLEDRVKYIIDEIKGEIKFAFDIDIKEKKGKVETVNVVTYVIVIKNSKKFDEVSYVLINKGFKLVGNDWVLDVV